jgi:predicted O-methyltransferase YrrM
MVSRALDLSRRRGFVSSSRVETGRLLAALAASRSGILAECGTGCGVGAAWLLSAATPGTRIVTAELDPDLAEAVTDMFAGQPTVEVVAGDWTSLYDYGPFSLLFLDVREAKASGTDVVT